MKAGGSTLQDVRHTWDSGGNLTTRENLKDSETESFSYDHLDRLISAGGPYATESYAYSEIGNMTSKGGQSYTYGSSKPHAVTAVGSTNYNYDANGNMTNRGTATLTWDAENRLTGVTGSASYVYDGNGYRVKKTEGGQTVLYVNRYYEKNLTTATVTLYYYLGDKMVAYKKGASLAYMHQDHLTGTSLTTNDSGVEVGTIRYMPFGTARTISGSLPAQKYTGQRLDDVGLYYYGARYYDPGVARFISADTIVPDFANPQSLNRYSYVLNNPLKYIDPSGQEDRFPKETAYYNGEISYEEYLAAYAAWAGSNSSNNAQSNVPVETGNSSVETIFNTLVRENSEIFNNYARLLGKQLDQIDNNTKLGLIAAFYSGGTARSGPDGTIIVEGVSPNSLTGRIMSMLDAGTYGALTVGDVILTGVGSIDIFTLSHEMEHVRQYRELGDFFLEQYISEYIKYGYGQMPMENRARKAAINP